MTDLGRIISRSALTTCLVFGVMSAGTILAQDLSRYRNFQFGTGLPAVAKLAGVEPGLATLIHSRPALIQELEWRPRVFRTPSRSESVKDVVFTFYNGELFRAAIDYDRYQIAGLTDADLIEAISANYGLASKPTGVAEVAPALYGDQREVLAEWQDSEYRFELIRGSYGASFRLVGDLKRLEIPFRAANIEAARLDEAEAPQLEAARVAKAAAAEKTVLEQDRLENKPRFRP